MLIANLVYTGPVTRESATLQKQVCMLHAETGDHDEVIAAAPGGHQAGWIVPPVWQNTLTVEGEQFTFIKANPKRNKQKMLMWLLVRNIEC